MRILMLTLTICFALTMSTFSAQKAVAKVTPAITKAPIAKTSPVTVTKMSVPKTTKANVKVSAYTYSQKIKDIQAQYNSQIATIQKAKAANEATIVKITEADQKLSAKSDSLAEALKSKLQEIYDTEMKRIQNIQTNVDQRKTDIENVYRDAISGVK